MSVAAGGKMKVIVVCNKRQRRVPPAIKGAPGQPKQTAHGSHHAITFLLRVEMVFLIRDCLSAALLSHHCLKIVYRKSGIDLVRPPTSKKLSIWHLRKLEKHDGTVTMVLL
jgi:hypothetical protein